MNVKLIAALLVLAMAALVVAPSAFAQATAPPAQHGGGEASLKIPDLSQVHVGGIGGRTPPPPPRGGGGPGPVFGPRLFSPLHKPPVHAAPRGVFSRIF